jgi:hypothetical protein
MDENRHLRQEKEVLRMELNKIEGDLIELSRNNSINEIEKLRDHIDSLDYQLR